MLRTSSALRVLGPAEAEDVLELCARDPVTNAAAASLLLETEGDPARLGAQLWGWYDHHQLVSACWAGANLIPIEATSAAIEGFAGRARRMTRRCLSVMGEQSAVLDLWERLEPSWGPARDVRASQPLLVCDGPVQVAPDPAVRLARVDEVDLVLPAAAAMFTEEIGYSPIGRDGGTAYRTSLLRLIGEQRTFVRVERSGDRQRVIFKADLGSVTPRVAQVHAVWVTPDLRGRGLAAPAVAAVVEATQRRVAPVVSLYVNDYNARALATYDRVGFRRVGTFATVLL